MVTQAPKRSAVIVALCFVLSCIGLTTLVWTSLRGPFPFAPKGYVVHAVFPETGQLVTGADVRVSGINIGKVTGIQAQGVNSRVTMDLSQQYSPIPRDTHAILRQKTLLGEGFIELSPGTGSGAKLPDGGTIPSSHVQRAVALDQVLNSFTPQTQRALQQFLDGTSVALSGEGQALNDAVGNLDPTTSELAQVVGLLNQQQGDVRGVISNLGAVMTTLGNRSADVQSLVRAGDQVLSATAARDAALTQTVNSLPLFLYELRQTLLRLNGTLGIAKPTLAALMPVAPLLRPALSEVVQLSGPAVKLLHEAPALLNAADRALPAIGAFTNAFNGTVAPLLAAARQVVPMINFIQLYPREITAAMANLAAFLNARAPSKGGVVRRYLRAMFAVNNESLFGQSERPGTNRHNAYIAPGELANVGLGGLLSSDCNNVGTPTLADAIPGATNVPCRLQPKYPWNRVAPTTRRDYYPHVTLANK
jgi:phospholipid/cholesterol/gamma-HCH transport system substrate-binding protein